MSDAPGVAIVVPTLDEATTLPRLARHLQLLDPPPADVLVVDGGSADGTADLAAALGLRLITGERGRAKQINLGVAEARAPLVCVLHADTLPPDDLVAVVRRTLAVRSIALGGFTPLLSGSEKVRWLTSFHNWIKTWYAPLLLRPHLFVRGVRLLFGDHAMFFRRDQFLAAGGCDPGLPVMEEADLCIKMARFGRVRLVNRVILTSDRRVAAWGEARANWIYFTVGLRWAVGAHRRLGEAYPDVR